MRASLVALAFATSLTNAHAPETPSEREARFAGLSQSIGRTYDDVWLAASKLDLSKPVTDEQAWVLAQAYFSAYISGCGELRTPSDRHGCWSFQTLVGISARKGPEIRVDKKTGVTSSKGLVTVDDPATYAKLVRKDR